MCLLIIIYFFGKHFIVSAPTLVSFVCLNIQGPKTQVFYFKGDPKDGTKMAIYTKYDGTDYYLEPSDHDTHKEIIAVPEDKRKYKYPFKFPS